MSNFSEQNEKNRIEDGLNLRMAFFKYLSYWPFYLISIVACLTLGHLFNLYANETWKVSSTIQMVDEAYDSEMALPTEMTIFNRSMINLENEQGILKSYRLHERVVKKLKSNVEFFEYRLGKETPKYRENLFPDFIFEHKFSTDTLSEKSSYFLEIENGKLEIDHYDKDDELLQSVSFNSLSTFTKNHSLPFEIKINPESLSEEHYSKVIRFNSLPVTIEKMIKKIEIQPVGMDSDQLLITATSENRANSAEYINTLVSEFDEDGISDRQREYTSTIDFVDNRSNFLVKELELIENKKKEFKQQNNLTNLSTDAELDLNQKFVYNSELFNAQSQKDLTELLKQSISIDSFSLMPINIGIQNQTINGSISEYNMKLNELNKFVINAGKNHPYTKNIEKQLSDMSKNILVTINNYLESLDVTISNLDKREVELSNIYDVLPENEKILRSIERELEIKESLFLLLLQKREEAAINLAVIKPSIKIIDSARASILPSYPNRKLVYAVSFLLGFLIPFTTVYFISLTDTKIHSKEQLAKLLEIDIPIIGEIPFIQSENIEGRSTNDRDQLSESIRIIIANLNFTLFNSDKDHNNLILVTSSIKGEGKTLVSLNMASMLSSKFKKVLLVGGDLRNPQIHKFIGKDKSDLGLTNHLFNYKENHWKNSVVKYKNIDILLSGSIPPNPTELLSSKRFSDFIDEAKNSYDYVIIDSAPCLLVSDTYEISKYTDTTVYVTRSNYTDIKLIDFIQESVSSKKLRNLNIVINAVGNSNYYGYKYAYKYGYQYGYKYGYSYSYGYNYGYNYGYGNENKK